MSAADAAIQKKKKNYRSSHLLNVASRTAALIISNEEIKDIMKIIKSLEEPGLLMKGISETNKNEAKQQKTDLFSMSLQILAVSILCILLTAKSRSPRGASHHPAFMNGSLAVSQTHLSCPLCGKIGLQSWTVVVAINKLFN